jgi:predicted NAD-dependent protein-ADP-ribosyltransferase YbiA (DUF1768 family)
MKALGRKCPNFDPHAWDKVSPAAVTAACLARAKANKELAEVYEENLESVPAGHDDTRPKLKRRFVEGSPRDRIWGVGLSFNDNRIDDERQWKGANRLGKCHDEACLAWGRQRLGDSDAMLSNTSGETIRKGEGEYRYQGTPGQADAQSRDEDSLPQPLPS